jgi:hypothetical protein
MSEQVVSRHESAQCRVRRNRKVEAEKTASELRFWTEDQMRQMARENESREGYALMCRRSVWA